MTSRISSGSRRADSAVDPTKSENITVTWRRSARSSGGTPRALEVLTRSVEGAFSVVLERSAAMASRRMRRWPTGPTPISFRSSCVRLGMTRSSISFSRNASSYRSRPRLRSQSPTSMVAPLLRLPCHDPSRDHLSGTASSESLPNDYRQAFGSILICRRVSIETNSRIPHRPTAAHCGSAADGFMCIMAVRTESRAMVEALPGRVGRRLAAIVAADVAGYSRLMGLDEVGTARTLREHRKVTDALVAKHGGRIVKTTGDGVLLEFPSVVDAVECAVAWQVVMVERNEGVPDERRMLFRIGINLGDILIEGDGDILGDGVNVAARLEGIAEPGGICISSSAHDQVRGKVPVDFTDLGEQTLKNIARPIRAYAIGLNANYTDRAVSPLSSAPHLSIVVLPFANIGGDPQQD